MTRQEVIELARMQYGTEPDRPWNDENEVLRHQGSKKWYGLLMEVPKSVLGLGSQEHVQILNVKCDPILTGTFRKKPGFLPAYHMNKEKWITILLDGSAPEEDIRFLLDRSYAMTLPPVKGKARKQPAAEAENNGKTPGKD